MRHYDLVEKDLIGPKTPSADEIAKKHGVSKKVIDDQIKKGTKVEKEHTWSQALANEIARDHEAEVFDYYDKLKKVEEDEDTLTLPELEIGDELKTGRWKNKKSEITGFKKDKNNHPIAKTTKGDQQIFKPRITKLMPENINEPMNYKQIIHDIIWTLGDDFFNDNWGFSNGPQYISYDDFLKFIMSVNLQTNWLVKLYPSFAEINTMEEALNLLELKPHKLKNFLRNIWSNLVSTYEQGR